MNRVCYDWYDYIPIVYHVIVENYFMGMSSG